MLSVKIDESSGSSKRRVTKPKGPKTNNGKNTNGKSMNINCGSSEADDSKHCELLSLLTDIRQQNSSTNLELSTLQKAMTGKFVAIDEELQSNRKSVDIIATKLTAMESRIDAVTHDKELAKQQQLKNNNSIFGFPKVDGEEVTKIAIRIFGAFGCNFVDADFNAVYRSIGKSAVMSTIIVKFNDFNKKLSALEMKAKKPVVLGDIADCPNSQRDKPIFINNHVTPFFARLLAVGRQGVRDKKIHSCWIGSTGCLVKTKEDAQPKSVR